MNSPQQFRLHWKNHSPNFVSVFAQLLNSESLVDVTLAADGKQIQAHRVVLSACSSYFQELFVSHPCKHPIVILKDIKFKDLCTVIHFMYHGEVNIAQEHLDSILKTAEVLQVKGFSEVTDRETFTAALLTHDSESPSVTASSDHFADSEERLPSKRKRQRHRSSSSHSDQDVASRSKRELFQSVGNEKASSSFRSSTSSEGNALLKEKLSFLEQSSMESDTETSSKGEELVPMARTGGSAAFRSNGSEIYSSVDSDVRSKRSRTLIRQQCIKKENEMEQMSPMDDVYQSSSNNQPLTHILSKSLTQDDDMDTKSRGQAFLQLPPIHHLPRQRSQPILPSQSTNPFISASSSSSSQSLGYLSTGIPTVAVTPVSATSNTTIEPFPAILRVVSYEEMNSANSILTRPTSQLGPGSSSRNLQVPSAGEAAFENSSQGLNRLKARLEENMRRTVSNPGPSPSPPVLSTCSTGHCPVLRTGAALSCNYCWNTVDSHKRILRRKTKYHCPDCQVNLCIVPCFQDYHEKYAASNQVPSNSTKDQSSSHQLLHKMSSI